MPEAVIIAGGPATRLYPLTHKVTKAMLKVAGKPFIAHQLELLADNGIRKAVILAGYLGGQIQDFVKNGSSFGIDVEFSFDGKKLLGTGGAIKKALSLLGENFFVMYGDSYLPVNFRKINEYFCKHDKLGLMTIIKNNNRWDKSNIIFKGKEISRYDKQHSYAGMNYIDYGLALLRKEVFLSHKYPRAFGLDSVYKNLIVDDQLLAFEVKKRFYEIGSFGGLNETKKYLSARSGKQTIGR
jgi:NDP-sugar pyrophosphorylase family protein